MVSLRRRRLLGLSSGRSSSLSPLPRFSDSGYANPNRSPISTGPASLGDVEMKESTVSVESTQSSNASYSSSSSMEQPGKQSPVVGVKKRKRHHWQKYSERQESGLMKGVYFKNMKWQAAIKVDKKQVHLGTFASLEEAAHLYDRAAFLCGRNPNCVLSEEEKQELMKMNWEEFLAMSRTRVANKMYKSRADGGLLVMSSDPSPHNKGQESEQEVENNDVVSPAAAAKEEAEGGNYVVSPAAAAAKEAEGGNYVVSPAAAAKEAEGGNYVVSPKAMRSSLAAAKATVEEATADIDQAAADSEIAVGDGEQTPPPTVNTGKHLILTGPSEEQEALMEPVHMLTAELSIQLPRLSIPRHLPTELPVRSSEADSLAILDVCANIQRENFPINSDKVTFDAPLMLEFQSVEQRINNAIRADENPANSSATSEEASHHSPEHSIQQTGEPVPPIRRSTDTTSNSLLLEVQNLTRFEAFTSELVDLKKRVDNSPTIFTVDRLMYLVRQNEITTDALKTCLSEGFSSLQGKISSLSDRISSIREDISTISLQLGEVIDFIKRKRNMVDADKKGKGLTNHPRRGRDRRIKGRTES